MDSITRSGRKMLKSINKKLTTASEFHFTVTPTKARKGKLFDDIPDGDSTINTVDSSNSDIREGSPLKEQQNDETHNSDVGLSYLPTQIRRKILSKPLDFTLMVAGSSCLGKSTFVNSLFLTDIYSDEYPGPTKRCSSTVSVESHSVVLTENDVSLNITVVDTPGFASELDNRKCWTPLVTYLKSQHCEYLRGEINFNPEITDTRVNCCLYFLRHNVHQLEKMDIECMKHLCKHVNLIPVIAKADCMTPEEIKNFKHNIRQDLKKHEINIFSFHLRNDDGSTTEVEFPFAVAGSNFITETTDGRRVRARNYPWGTFEIDNPEHCDTALLRDLLVKHCMYDLIESTHSTHYENYRQELLSRQVITKPVFKHEEKTADYTIDNTLIRAMDYTCEDTLL